MPSRSLLYYVTDRRQLASSEAAQRARLVQKIAEAARCGIDYIQLREKDLPARELEQLAAEAAAAVRQTAGGTSPARLLINSRPDIALAVGADGVHLPHGDLPAGDVRAIFARAGHPSPLISVACHSLADVEMAEAQGADLGVLAAVFEKQTSHGPLPGLGLETLRSICRRTAAASSRLPIVALGGITLENAAACIAAGAAGIAGIRLFQENDICQVVAAIRDIPLDATNPYTAG